MSNGLSERRSADAPVPLFFATYRFSLHFPVSITYFTPGIVMEVSAMFVARMTLRIPPHVIKLVSGIPVGVGGLVGGSRKQNPPVLLRMKKMVRARTVAGTKKMMMMMRWRC